MPKHILASTEVEKQLRSIILGVEEWPEDTALWAKDGSGGDETTVIPADLALTQARAYAEDYDDPSQTDTQLWDGADDRAHSRRTVGIFVALMAVVVISAVWVIALFLHRDEPMKAEGRVTTMPAAALPPPSTTAPPAPAGPTLDGTYQFAFDIGAATYRGKATPPQRSGIKTSWFAFRSSCTPAGCTANGVRLDPTDRSRRNPVSHTDTFTYTDGQWVDGTSLIPSDIPGCTTASYQWTLRPRPDGTLDGTETITVEGDCTSTGNRIVTPFTAMRIGPVPAGVFEGELMKPRSYPQTWRRRRPGPTAMQRTTTTQTKAIRSSRRPGSLGAIRGVRHGASWRSWR
jgi:hypothetical protein